MKFPFAFVTLLIRVSFVCLLLTSASQARTPHSQYDLTDVHFSSEQRVSLIGNWCFNWAEFIQPESVCPNGSALIPLPSKWNHLDGRSSYPRQGFASYSTTILLPDSAPQLGLYVPLFYRAGEFFINGESVLKVGQVGKNSMEETPRDKRSIIALPQGVKTIRLVVHVSSFHHIDGGLNSPLEIALLADLQDDERIRSFSSIFLVGSSLSFAAYFLFVGIGRGGTHDFVYVAGAASIFTYTLRIIGTEQIWLFIVPSMPAFWTLKFEYYGLVLGIPAFLYYLYYLFPNNVHKQVCQLMLFLGVTSFFLVTLLPTEIYVWIRDFWIGLFCVFMLYFLYCVLQAMMQKQTDAYIVGFIAITVILTTSHDLFVWFDVFSGNRLLNFTYLFLLLGNTSILTLRMIRSAKREAVLSNHIQQLNIGLQHKVEQRTEQLAQKMEELNQQRHIAEQASAAKSKFLATASHDLRQPLHALGLFIGSLRFSRNSQEKAEIQDKLEITHISLTELFDGLLDISKIDANAIETNIQSIAVKPMLEKIILEFEPSAVKKEIQLKVVGKELYVVSDPLWLERILRNLVSNALRYTQRGRVLLGLRTLNGKALIQVWDTGIGIPDTQLEHIFDEFTQLKNPLPAGRLGLGLGLSIVQKLSDLLGHEISVKSKLDQGTVFTLSLKQTDLPPVTAPTEILGFQDNPIKNKVILVVDDEVHILDAMRLMIEKWGGKVLTADSMAAVKKVIDTQGHAPDMLITDFRFSDAYTGLDIIDYVNQHLDVSIPTLVVTGDTSKRKVAMFKEAGVKVLHKPVQQAKIRMMLNYLCKET
jgi:signal transduction histidine kinase/CheY-like chemotaxis protein